MNHPIRRAAAAVLGAVLVTLGAITAAVSTALAALDQDADR